MIALGYAPTEKMYWVKKMAKENPEIKKVIVFSPPPYSLGAEAVAAAAGCEAVEYTYDDIIMYRVFYPLLEEIDDTRMLVINECMRTTNRNDLTYNCLTHYLNQTKHRLVFEFYPFVSDTADFMILLDREQPNRYKGRGFDPAFLSEPGVVLKVLPHHYTLSQAVIDLPSGAQAAYEAERDRLFDSLGNGDPDNVPRRLHVWCGRYKRPYIDDHLDQSFVARNARFGRSNVTTYKNAAPGVDYHMLDIPCRQMEVNDYLKRTGIHTLRFISTGLSVDNVYYHRIADWIKTLEDFYAAAGICI